VLKIGWPPCATLVSTSMDATLCAPWLPLVCFLGSCWLMCGFKTYLCVCVCVVHVLLAQVCGGLP